MAPEHTSHDSSKFGHILMYIIGKYRCLCVSSTFMNHGSQGKWITCSGQFPVCCLLIVLITWLAQFSVSSSFSERIISWAVRSTYVACGSSTPNQHMCSWVQLNWGRNESVHEVIQYSLFTQKVCSFEQIGCGHSTALLLILAFT